MVQLHHFLRVLGIELDFRLVKGIVQGRFVRFTEGIARPCVEEWLATLQGASWRKSTKLGDRVKEDKLCAYLSAVAWTVDVVRTKGSGANIHAKSIGIACLNADERMKFQMLTRIADFEAREIERSKFLKSHSKQLMTRIQRLGTRIRENRKGWVDMLSDLAAREYMVRGYIPENSAISRRVMADAKRRLQREYDRNFSDRYKMTPAQFLRLSHSKMADVLDYRTGEGRSIGLGQVERLRILAQGRVDRESGGLTLAHLTAAWKKEIGPRWNTLARS